MAKFVWAEIVMSRNSYGSKSPVTSVRACVVTHDVSSSGKFDHSKWKLRESLECSNKPACETCDINNTTIDVSNNWQERFRYSDHAQNVDI